MKRKSVIFSILAVVLLAGAIASYFLPWIYQVEMGQGGYNEGYKVALNFDGTGKNFLSLAGLVVLVLGFFASLVMMIVKLARSKKEVDPEKALSAKKSIIILIIAGLIVYVPLIGAASAMEVYGVANDTYEMGGKLYGYFTGPGIPLTSIFSVLGGASFYYSYSGFIS